MLQMITTMADTSTKSTRGRKPTLTDSERKRRKKESNIKINQSRIHVGNQYDRWNKLKVSLGLPTHAEVAKVLLDRYFDQTLSIKESSQRQSMVATTSRDTVLGHITPDIKHAKVPTSTPGTSSGLPKPHFECDVSDISSSESSNRDGELSGVEALPMKKCRMEKRVMSESFLNPFNLSVINISEEDHDESHCSEDEDYEPSFNITLRPTDENFSSLRTGTYLEEDSESENEDENMEESNMDAEADVMKNINIDDIESVTTDQPFLVYFQCLLQLANLNIPRFCLMLDCKEEICVDKNTIGSALYLKWVCKKGHMMQKWCSQPILNRRLHGGDLMLASTILLSGNNFRKIELLAKFFQLPIISNTTFHRIQKTYLLPAVEEFWNEQQRELIQKFKGKDLVVLGDGRMDSPGHSAQFCSYTFMEYTSKRILCIITMDKRMTELKSTNLEKACFLKGLKFLQNSGLKVIEVVTDAHSQIAAVMRKEYPHIRHSFDIWHGTKSLGKKVISIAHESDKKELLEWTKDITNHFWYAAQISETYGEFIGIWFGILHHVTDEHEWVLSYGGCGQNSCRHSPLVEPRTKGWLKKGSPAHVALREVVMDKRRLNQLHYFLNCRSTAELENFQNLILVYASKRFSYTPPTYHCRNLLAALDHNVHSEREVKINKDGSTRYQRSFNKKSGIWSVHELKVEKTYNHIPSLLRKIVAKRLEDLRGMCGATVLSPDDPRRVSRTIAPVPPPPTQVLVEKQKSRFGDPDKTLDYTYDDTCS